MPMNFHSRKKVHEALKTGILTIHTQEGDLSLKRGQVEWMRYSVEFPKHAEHAAKIGGRVYKMYYRDFSMLKAFWQGKDPSYPHDKWVRQYLQEIPTEEQRIAEGRRWTRIYARRAWQSIEVRRNYYVGEPMKERTPLTNSA